MSTNQKPLTNSQTHKRTENADCWVPCTSLRGLKIIQYLYWLILSSSNEQTFVGNLQLGIFKLCIELPFVETVVGASSMCPFIRPSVCLSNRCQKVSKSSHKRGVTTINDFANEHQDWENIVVCKIVNYCIKQAIFSSKAAVKGISTKLIVYYQKMWYMH